MKKYSILKVLALLILATVWHTATAQYRIIYIPGAGEHQFGLNISPSYSAQMFGVAASTAGPNVGSESINIEGTLNNNIGFSTGLFYGYETRDSRTLGFGSYISASYSINPFSGTVSITRDEKAESHTVSYTAQRILIHGTSFLSYMINDLLSVSAGIGVSFAPQLKSKVKVDGVAKEELLEDENLMESLLLGVFNFHLDANAGVKYWFNDEWYCGLRIQYCFYTLSLLSLFDSDNNTDLDQFPNGAVYLDIDEDRAGARYFLPKSTLQAVFSIGYVW